MTEENLLYRDPASFPDLGPQERENLRVVMEELKGWDTQSVDRVLSVMAKDAVYHDITLPPAKGWEGIRKFGEGWVKAAPDFHVFVEKFVVQRENVVNMGRISGTIKGQYFGLPATGKRFDCMYCQVATVRNDKIVYVRDHWDSITMSKQVGWSNP